MNLVADRFPGADEIDTAYKTTLDVIKAYPNLKGIIAFGSNGPIGAGNARAREAPRQEDRRRRHGAALAGQAAAHGRHHPRGLSCGTRPMPAMPWSRSPSSMLDGTEIVDGIEMPGLGKASVDVANKLIKVDKIMDINKDTVDSLIAQGL